MMAHSYSEIGPPLGLDILYSLTLQDFIPMVISNVFLAISKILANQKTMVTRERQTMKSNDYIRLGRVLEFWSMALAVATRTE